MRIAFIIYTFPALSTTFILNQITGLLDLGHDVQVFSVIYPEEKKTHSDFIKYQLKTRVHYFPIIPKNKISLFSKLIFLLIQNFHKGPKILLRSIKLSFFNNEKISPKYIFYLFPFIGKKFDILHCHFGPMGQIGTYLKECGINGKIVTTFHGYDLSSYIIKNGEEVYKKLFLFGDCFLTISNHFRQKLIKYGCSSSKIKIHNVGIDLDKFISIREFINPIKIIQILTIGRLCEKKGYEYGIKAIKKILEKYNNIFFRIVGDGLLRIKLESLVSELEIERFIEFTGALDQDEVIRYYNNTDIFLLPSITAQNGDTEGTPTVLLEAQAMNLPVISTFHSGIPEIVKDGQTGFLVPEKDIEALVERLDFLITHPRIRQDMGRKGRIFIKKYFDIKKLNLKLVDNYRSLLME